MKGVKAMYAIAIIINSMKVILPTVYTSKPAAEGWLRKLQSEDADSKYVITEMNVIDRAPLG